MSDPSDVWQNSAPANDSYSGENREASPRREDRERERERSPPRRERSRSPARNGGGGGGRDGRDAPRGRNDDGSVNPGNNLHVSGLARSINDQGLEDLFSKYGKIVKAQVMNDPHTQESRGFGFVMFETNEEAEAAISALSGTTQEGRLMTITHAKRARARTPTPGRYHGVKFEGRGPPGYGGGGHYGGGGYGGGGGRYGGGYEDRPYQPRSYDSRYADRGPRGYDDRRGGGGYDDRGPRGYDRYDDRRGGGYDDRRGGGGGGYDDYRRGPPPPDDYYRSRYDDRRDDRPRYDERPRY